MEAPPPSSSTTRASELDGRPGPAQVAASGPRAAGAPRDYELLLEIIFEGVRLHYGPARVVRTDDPDLALLVGDQLYALGLEGLPGWAISRPWPSSLTSSR